jgi:hypothetical protein
MGISRRKLLGTSVLAGAAWPGILAAGERGVKGPTRLGVSQRKLLLRHTWTIARNSSDFKDNVFVRVERDGVTGWGEAAPNVRYGQSAEQTIAAVEKVRALVEAGDWFQYVGLREQWERAIPDQSCACAALDIAILDWVGLGGRNPGRGWDKVAVAAVVAGGCTRTIESAPDTGAVEAGKALHRRDRQGVARNSSRTPSRRE